MTKNKKEEISLNLMETLYKIESKLVICEDFNVSLNIWITVLMTQLKQLNKEIDTDITMYINSLQIIKDNLEIKDKLTKKEIKESKRATYSLIMYIHTIILDILIDIN